MYLHEGRSINFAVTPGHRFWTTSYWLAGKPGFVPVERLPRWSLHRKSCNEWLGIEEPEKIEIPSKRYAKQRALLLDRGDFYELVGWFLSEGSLLRNARMAKTPNPYRGISIAQTPGTEGFKRIKTLLIRMGVHYCVHKHTFKISGTSLAAWFLDECVGEKLVRTFDKWIPRWMLKSSRPYLHRLFEGLMYGDGCKSKHSTGWVYATVSKRLADDVQELCVRLGWASSVSLVELHKKNPKHADCWRVNIHKPRGDCAMVKRANIRAVHYVGEVGCVTVEPYHTVFVRRNGKAFWCGNTEFDESKHVRAFDVPAPGVWRELAAKDWGYVNPCSVHFYGVDYDDRVFVWGEHYRSEWRPSQHAEILKPRLEARKIKTVLAGPDAWGREKDGTTVAGEFMGAGIILVQANNEVAGGIQFNKRLLADNKVTIHPECVNLIREIKEYRWAPQTASQAEKSDAREEPVKKDDHAVDDFRYAGNFIRFGGLKRPEIVKPEDMADRRIKELQEAVISERERGTW